MFLLLARGSQPLIVVRLAFQFFSFLCVALGQPAFFPWLGPFAATLGFALHWKSLEDLSPKNIGKISFLWFFLVQLVQLSWMANLKYQGVYILALYFLLSAGLAWQFAFITKIAHRNSRFDGVSMLALAGLWTLLEWGRLYVLCGFAFNFLGISLSCYSLPLQTASLFGVLGMSFWVFISNLAAWRFFNQRSFSLGLKWGVLVVFPYLFGFFHIAYQEPFSLEEKASYSVLLVQTGLSPSQKYCLRGKERDFLPPIKQWEKMLQSIFPQKEASLDLLALPEAVVPFGLDLYIYKLEEVESLLTCYLGERVLSSFPPIRVPFALGSRVSNAYIMQTLSNFFNAPLLAGLDYQDGSGKLYNSAFYFEPGSVFPKRYDKRVLLPLAEYMPFSFLKSLSRYYGVEDFFTSGSQVKVFSDSLLISPSICYEELFPSLMREGRKKGAKLFVSLSNDGWYPSSKLPVQHFTQGLIRAVENGVPLVRACNTGVTAAVDGLGRVVGKLQDEKGDVEKISGCLLVQVPRVQHVTGFALWGELPLILGCFFFVMIALMRVFQKKLPFLRLDVLEIALDENERNG